MFQKFWSLGNAVKVTFKHYLINAIYWAKKKLLIKSFYYVYLENSIKKEVSRMKCYKIFFIPCSRVNYTRTGRCNVTPNTGAVETFGEDDI